MIYVLMWIQLLTITKKIIKILIEVATSTNHSPLSVMKYMVSKLTTTPQ